MSPSATPATAATKSANLDGPASLGLAIAISLAIGILFWHSRLLWPFKLLVVLMHESGHAAATLLVGGSVDRIAVSPDEGGVTFSRYPPGLLRQIVISSAGYVGSTVSGCVLLWTAARARLGRWPLLALAAWTTAVTVLYVRDGFTFLFVGAAALALGLVARFGAPLLRRGLLVFLATFSCSYALYDIKDDLLHFTSSGKSDADALAHATLIPAIVWGAAWGLLSILLVALTLRRIFLTARPTAMPGAGSGTPRSRSMSPV